MGNGNLQMQFSRKLGEPHLFITIMQTGILALHGDVTSSLSYERRFMRALIRCAMASSLVVHHEMLPLAFKVKPVHDAHRHISWNRKH